MERKRNTVLSGLIFISEGNRHSNPKAQQSKVWPYDWVLFKRCNFVSSCPAVIRCLRPDRDTYYLQYPQIQRPNPSFSSTFQSYKAFRSWKLHNTAVSIILKILPTLIKLFWVSADVFSRYGNSNSCQEKTAIWIAILGWRSERRHFRAAAVLVELDQG